jgi:quercetin dioxygenase-like cupin family protein
MTGNVLRTPLVTTSGLTISHLADDSFVPKGRWGFFQYRDLAVAGATGGDVRVSITKGTGAVHASTGWHYHICDLQVIYFLEGWADLALAGEGVVRLTPGTCVQIPPGLVHNELDMAPDMVAMEISIPEKIETVQVDEPAGWAALVASQGR